MLEEAKMASQSQGYDVEKLFTAGSKKSTGGRPRQDYRLARFACYMVALSADGNKSEVAAAKTYFAVMTREQEELQQLVEQIGDNPFTEVAQRIARRQELTEANKRLMARAQAAGVITQQQAAIFFNYGYQGLYAGETRKDIQERKGIPEREEIGNWMGAVETMTNVLRAVVAEARLERNNIQAPDDANQTHYDAGKTVRGWLTSEGIYPEQLPTPTKSYRQIVKEEAERIAREDEWEQGLWGAHPPQELPPGTN
ncbi:MAG: DNA damage-inducible protein D [Ktedonobacterales bacterium]|nr:DNA damage-inducible protein D [Ktedonobacterales bacterium]